MSTGDTSIGAAVVEAAMAGDIDAPVTEQHWWREQITAPSAARQFRLIARNARQIYDRAGPLLELLRSAARVDPEVEAVSRSLEEERHRRSRLSARALVDKGALRPGIRAVEAPRTLWALNRAGALPPPGSRARTHGRRLRPVAGVVVAARPPVGLTHHAAAS